MLRNLMVRGYFSAIAASFNLTFERDSPRSAASPSILRWAYSKGVALTYRNESEFEAYIRALIGEYITKAAPSIYALKNKKAVDILICKDTPPPELFFIEVKYHQTNHGRLGFGSGKGGGFQPEIVSTKPAYFESNLRWVLASEEHEPGKVLFLTSEVVRNYLAGGKVAEKFNNFQKRIFQAEHWLNEYEFVEQLRHWLGVKAAQPIIPPGLAHKAAQGR
jgi:hypothetical protein